MGLLTCRLKRVVVRLIQDTIEEQVNGLPGVLSSREVASGRRPNMANKGRAGFAERRR
jgi:hypothetical protein